MAPARGKKPFLDYRQNWLRRWLSAQLHSVIRKSVKSNSRLDHAALHQYLIGWLLSDIHHQAHIKHKLRVPPTTPSCTDTPCQRTTHSHKNYFICNCITFEGLTEESWKHKCCTLHVQRVQLGAGWGTSRQTFHESNQIYRRDHLQDLDRLGNKEAENGARA